MPPSTADRDYPRLLGWIVLLAVPITLLGFAFLFVYQRGLHLLWERLPEQIASGWGRALLTPALAMGGGLLVGLATRYLGVREHSKPLAEEVSKEGRIEYRGLPAYLLTGLLSLLSGASLGPEAPLIHLAGGISTWFAERRAWLIERKRLLTLAGVAAVLGTLFGQPVATSFLALEFLGLVVSPLYYHLIGAAAAAVVGAVLAQTLGIPTIAGLLPLPVGEAPRAVDLLWALLLGALGIPLALVFKVINNGARRFFAPLRRRSPLWTPVLGGAIFGAIGVLAPQTLFSGEHEITTMMREGAALGAGLLALLGLLKLVTLSVSLNSGFLGGFIFPVLYAGAALGMAVWVVAPPMPQGVAVLCTMGGMAGAIMRMPFSVIILLTTLGGAAYAPPIVVATLVPYLAAQQLAAAGDARAAFAAAEKAQGGE